METRQQVNQSVGFFIASYQISEPKKVGAPVLHLQLGVSTPSETVTGHASITQATNPPVSCQSQVTGTFTYMTVMPNTTHILVVCTGCQPTPGGGNVNFECRMVLSQDWKTGTCNYKYQDGHGNWHSIENCPVSFVNGNTLN
jgi:hypothetical protein